jgi:hypothetical protein
MAKKGHKPEEIVAKLRQVDVTTQWGRINQEGSQTHDHNVNTSTPLR